MYLLILAEARYGNKQMSVSGIIKSCTENLLILKTIYTTYTKH